MRTFARHALPDAFQKIYDILGQRASTPMWRALLLELDVQYQVHGSPLAHVPPQGATVVMANHPFGVLDGAIVMDMVQRVRDDVRIVTDTAIAALPRLQPYCIGLTAGPSAVGENLASLRQAIAWLRQGGALVMFPAAQVSSWHFQDMQIYDGPWRHLVARLINCTGATAVPVYIHGSNSATYHLLETFNGGFGRIRLAQELHNKRGRTIQVRLGRPVDETTLKPFHSAEQRTSYLRWQTYRLAQGHATAAAHYRVPVAPSAPASTLAAEVDALRRHRLLHEDNAFMVLHARAAEVPGLMAELGRAREMTFRAAGEGTGMARDLDVFDARYDHLLLWHKETQQLAGAYRVASVQPILAEQGPRGLYTHTLFRYRPAFFTHLGPALELGRSFITAPFQRHYSALLCLWKALAQYVLLHAQTPVLLGAVSISRGYSEAARELMVRHFAGRDPLAAYVEPRTPPVARQTRGCDMATLGGTLASLEALFAAVAAVESDGKGVPVLLRQYLKLGGRVVAFNVDRAFADVLDALVVVDLRTTDLRLLGRFMGAEAADAFRRHHARHAA